MGRSKRCMGHGIQCPGHRMDRIGTLSTLPSFLQTILFFRLLFLEMSYLYILTFWFSVAAGSSRGHVIVYDARLGRIVGKFMNVHQGPIYKVSWNSHACTSDVPFGNHLATASGDGFCCIIRPEDGAVVKKLTLPNESFGCHWSPLQG